MACFIAPLVEAIAVTAIRKSGLKVGNSPLMNRLPDLEKMLWGGTLMLIVDHLINGELSWAFPFFTALSQTDGAAVMWREILTVGVPMALVLTLAWAVWVLVKERKLKPTNI